MSNARIICLYILHLMVAVLIGVGLQDAAGRHVAQAIGNLAGLLFFLAVYRHVSGGKLFAWRPEKRVLTEKDIASLPRLFVRFFKRGEIMRSPEKDRKRHV